MSGKKFKYLVADTTAFINNVQLSDFGENIITVPDVVQEVKNKRQLRRLIVLPFDLQIIEPNPDNVAYVTQFSKKTGDFPSLSGIDLKVIALAYQLEKQYVGTEHLRKEPIVSKTIASKTKPEEFEIKTPVVGFYNPKKTRKTSENDESIEVSEEDNTDNLNEYSQEEIPKNVTENLEQLSELNDPKASVLNEIHHGDGDDDDDADEITEEHLRECFEKLKCNDDAQNQVDDVLVPEKKDDDSGAEVSEDDEDSCSNDEEDGDDDDDDDSSWITPSNITKLKKELIGDVEEISSAVVACMSTDFAIQNVLKQMNLIVAALDGRIIKHLRTYILRCYACFKKTSVMTKVFCPNCGNKTLKRVAVSIDENGQQVIHINTKRPLTAKYKNQSIPIFRGGKHSRNPILFEDQPIPKQMPSRKAKTKTCALEEDYIAGISPFALRDIDSKSALLRAKGNLKQWARNNEYEEFRRKKHYNRFVK